MLSLMKINSVRKIIATIYYFSLILLLVGIIPVRSEEIASCKEASEPADYGEILDIPNDLKTLIEQYRNSWGKICSDQKSADFSLSQLFSQAKEIELQFKTITDQEDLQFRQSDDSEGRFDRAVKIDEILRKKYPAFIPGFKGSYMDWTYFKPSLRKFSEAVSLGNDEDKIFFKQYSSDNLFPPWIEGTWDYGGCRRYGQFKWVEQLKAALELGNNLTSKIYLDINSTFIEDMLKELTETSNICTCNEKQSVLPDLISVSDFLKDKTEYISVYTKINERIKAIQSGEIKIRSEAEGHCSGG